MKLFFLPPARFISERPSHYRAIDQMMKYFGCKHRPVLNLRKHIHVDISVAFLLNDQALLPICRLSSSDMVANSKQSMSRPGPQGGIPATQPPQQPQAARPTPPGYPQQPQFQGFYPPPYGQRFGPPTFPPGPGFPNFPYGAPPGWLPPGQGFPQGPGNFPPQFPLGPPGQQQTPPPQQRPMAPGSGLVNMPKPTSELPVGEKPPSKPTSRNVTPGPGASAQVAPTPPVESKPSVAEAVQAPMGPAAQSAATSAPNTTAPPATASKAPPVGPKSGRVQPAIPIASNSRPPVPVAANPPLASATGNNAAITEATRAATAAVAAAMAKLPQPGAQPKTQPTDGAVDHVTKKMGEMKPYDGQRPQRGGYHSRGGRGGYRAQHQAHGKKIEVPQTDYDFESANARFNKQDLLKEAIGSGSPIPDAEEAVPNGDADTADVSAEAAAPSDVAGYNRSTSFFDNISSEARDREDGANRTREWRGEEEKRNIETFGQGSVDGYRGSYRGRGRGRGYGRGRGGYGRGYGSRGRGGFRGRGAPQSTGVPTHT